MNAPRALFLLCLLALHLACSGGGTRRRIDEGLPDAGCGDGRVTEGEECDGSDLAGKSCSALGFDHGTLSCDATCKLATFGCVKLCGNGAMDPGEECDGEVGSLTCDTWGQKRCTAECKVSLARCVATPYEHTTPVQLAKGGFSLLADLEPKGTGELLVAVSEPSDPRLSIHRYTQAQGFVTGSPLRFLDQLPLFPLAADVDGDGQLDVAAIDADGTVDRYRFITGQNRYELETLSDGGVGCPAAGWVGAAQVPGTSARTLVALGCPTSLTPLKAQALMVFPGGAQLEVGHLLPRTEITASTLAHRDGGSQILYVESTAAQLKALSAEADGGFLEQAPTPLPFVPDALASADFDGDGDLDLAAQTAGAVKVLENTGAGFAERETFAGPVAALLARDLDLDGRPDVAYLSGAKLVIFRNRGAYAFEATALDTGAGTPLSLSAADVDEDGDPDLAATYLGSGTATTTYVLLNKVQ